MGKNASVSATTQMPSAEIWAAASHMVIVSSQHRLGKEY
jgi:hypothetical protein